MPVIEAKSVTKRYGDITALDSLTLRVERGESFGFLGPNGAGKSTTINIFLDLVRRSSGSLSILGYDPEENPLEVRKRVGALPEAGGLYPRDTPRDHLQFAVRMNGADDDIDELLDRVGIADAADRPIGGFSKGMRQRLRLATALVGQPELLILDEPLGGLDPAGARVFRKTIREERARGATVFFSSHIMDQVELICDRVGIMHGGRLLLTDDVHEFRRRMDTVPQMKLSVEDPPKGLAEQVSDSDRVAQATVDDGMLHLTCRSPADKSAVVRQLDESGVAIADLHSRGPSLEQAFLRTAEAER
ncbi:copper ABC transporter ATP-binding protein [Haloferax elongans ATCC BAA-1513]|uniref:Copper ABC transporter ATP-binding protein n=1 Tax=Haloferax elongans ATCC BAA-1513 TaxID=1230453 RepID=M0H6S5_HALEO|nr:ABC transporter ATP-binding protein [Haloferax elongans]ELZ80231.1 copper ABC transporter ATP-binding protein [Haloferax elongans ATCC BAA-1513]